MIFSKKPEIVQIISVGRVRFYSIPEGIEESHFGKSTPFVHIEK